MSCRDIGRSTAPPLGTRSAISNKKPATRSSALLISTSECSCTRASSRAVSSHIWRATSLSLAASAITVPRLNTIILQSVIASAENVCTSPVSKPKMSPARMEGPDLTAPVHQDLVGAHRPADDLVEVFGGLVLPVDLGIGGKRHARAHELDRAGLHGGRRDWRATRLRCRLPLRNIPDCGLRQHGHDLQLMRPLVAAARGGENSGKIPPG